MTTKNHEKIYTQHNWTDKALVADGFLSYTPVKQITMVRMLRPEEAPKSMKAGDNTIIAEAGYWIAYVAGDILKARLDEYKPRPIAPDIFAETYRPWDESLAGLTPTEKYLKQLGCKTFYKSANVWAKQLETETWVQGMESDKPTLTPKGMWLCIGMEGEPWSITDIWFKDHYQLPGQQTTNRA